MSATAVIPLHDRTGQPIAWARVDKADAPALANWRWSLNDGYAVRGTTTGGRRRQIAMHRQIVGLTRGDGLQVDHINRDRLDNRKKNLRVVTRAEQQQNLTPRTGTTSRHRGVSWEARREKWIATARLNGRRVYIGQFDDEGAAGEAAADFRRENMPFSAEAVA